MIVRQFKVHRPSHETKTALDREDLPAGGTFSPSRRTLHYHYKRPAGAAVPPPHWTRFEVDAPERQSN